METQEATGLGSLFKIALQLTIPIAGLLYGTGLVAANLTFSFLGFVDFNVSHQTCIETGILFWVLFTLAMLPGKVWSTPIGRAGFITGSRKCVALLFSFLLLFIPVWGAFYSALQRGVGAFLVSLLFAGVIALLGVALNSCLAPLYSALATRWKSGPKSIASTSFLALRAFVQHVPEVTGAVVLIVLLFAFFCFLNLALPKFLGGIGSGETTVWLTSDAVPVLKTVNARSFIEPKSGLVRLDKANVLHLMNDKAILYVETSSKPAAGRQSPVTRPATIEIPVAWLKAQALGTTESQTSIKAGQSSTGVDRITKFLMIVLSVGFATWLGAALYLKYFWSIGDGWW